MRVKLLTIQLLVGALLLIFAGAANALPLQTHGTLDDVSWPNCKTRKDTTAVSQLGMQPTGIIGVNGGLDFKPNPCLNAEANHFVTYSLYINTGYPGVSYGEKFARSPLRCTLREQNCLAYNYGYHAASYSVVYATRQNVHSYFWWLDVETSNSWTMNDAQNRATIAGMVAALQKEVPFVRVGIYAYPGQWTGLMGPWHNDLPVWAASGGTTAAHAVPFCGMSFTGGPVLLSQYSTTLDYDLRCTSTYSQTLTAYASSVEKAGYLR